MPNYVCPICYESVIQFKKRYQCEHCDKSFPIIDGRFVVFFKNPKKAIIKTYLNNNRIIENHHNRNEQISNSMKTSNRRAFLLKFIKAVHDNRQFFELSQAKLTKYIGSKKLQKLANKQSRMKGYGDNFNYLIRDWGGVKNNEDEIDLIKNSIINILKLADKKYDHALFLGVGTGRLAVEFVPMFDEVIGIDNSFGMLYQFSYVFNKPLTLWKIRTKNCLETKNMLNKYHIKIPSDLIENAKKIQLVWSNAASRCFAKNSFNYIFSIYFSDVIILPDLIKQVKQILKPGGYFIHFGPLEYHFNDLAYHYGFDEFKQQWLDNNFLIIHESLVSSNANCDPDMMLTTKTYVNAVLLLKYQPTI